MCAFNADDAIPEIVLARFRDLIYIDPSDLASLRFQPNPRVSLIEGRKIYLHSGSFSTDGVHRTVKFDGSDF